MLERVNNSEDVKTLSIEEKKELARDIREYLLEVVSKNGGHLASNLGVVELTIALHSVFSLPNDKIIWDVGHQSYVHKILTGRKNELKTIRKLNGLSGFPKTKESPSDCFNTGHSSTSISAALGIARARDLKGAHNSVLAVIGDGALTGGMALEALNDAGCSKSNITVVLNDNAMSISKNVGGVNLFLSKLRTKRLYTKSNISLKKIINSIPYIGKPLVKIIQKIKRSIKQLIIPTMFFEDIGFTYLGPVDGHNIQELENILYLSKSVNGPVLVHVLTKKGQGYQNAIDNPSKFHGIAPFDIKTGKTNQEGKIDYSYIFGKKLVNIAKENKKVVAITASMADGTGLNEFKNMYPDRFFDVGIAEQHALGLAAGMAIEGLIPVVPIYSSFYQRAFDQVIHDIAIQNLSVVMCVDRAGITGSDGETHQGAFDLAFFRLIPNIEILAPKDFIELELMLEYAVNANKPIVIRYPRGGESSIKFRHHKEIKSQSAEVLKHGNNISIIAIGKMVSRAMEASLTLEKNNPDISIEVINVRFLKPLDQKTLIKSIKKTKKVVVMEDGTSINGLITSIKELIIDYKLSDMVFKGFSYPDEFIPHGSVEELEQKYGLDKDSMIKEINKML